MNLFKSKKNLLLLAASVIVWLGTCLLAMHWNTVYDGAHRRLPDLSVGICAGCAHLQHFYEQQTQ